jgi:hypothetical protein
MGRTTWIASGGDRAGATRAAPERLRRSAGVSGAEHRRELATAQHKGQTLGVALVGLDPVSRSDGDERGGDHLAADPHRPELAGQLVARGTGLVTGDQAPGILEATHQAPHPCLSG